MPFQARESPIQFKVAALLMGEAASMTTLPSRTGLVAAALLGLASSAAAQEEPATRIVVTATRRPVLEADAPAAISVITRADIERRSADNVLDAVRGETGVSLQGRAVGGRKVFGVRGLDSRHALFLVDGRRIGASDGVVGASDFQYDWIAVEDIERIEIVRGPMSVLYGSEALGGVVNIVTRKPGAQWHGSASAQVSHAEGDRGGSGWRAMFGADGPLGERTSLRAGLARSDADAVASPLDARISELEGRAKRDAWASLGWQLLDGQRVEAELRHGDERREADARERGGKRRYHVTVNEIERELASLAWDARWTARLDTQLRGYASTIDVVNTRTAGVTPNPSQRIEERVLEGQANASWTGHDAVAGFEARNEALHDPGLPDGRALLRHRSLFAQDTWRIAPPLTLTAGLRHDDHDRYGDEWSPRAYAVWRLDDGLVIKGGASHGFKVPNLKQVVPGSRQEGPNVFVGNPDLVPESSDAVELGLGVQAAMWQAQVMVFDQRVHDLIEVRLVAPGTTPGTGLYTYENLAQARLRGLEASGASTLPAGFSLGLNYSYLDAKDGDGQRLERRPRHSATLRLEWTGGPWRAGVDIQHSRDQLLPSSVPNTPAQPVPSLTLASAQVACTLPQGLEAALGVTNLGDLSMLRKSPLFTQAEAPRTWRLTLRGRW